MAQCAQTMNLQNILSSIVSHLQTSVSQDKLSATRVRQVTTTICKIQEYVRAINKLNVDDWEFAYLKAISLFGAGKNHNTKCELHILQSSIILHSQYTNIDFNYTNFHR